MMPNCTSDCHYGYEWWQVTIIVGAVFVCYLLMEAGHRLFDMWEDRHRDDPIDPPDDTPMEPPGDQLSLHEWMQESNGATKDWVPTVPARAEPVTEAPEQTVIDVQVVDETIEVAPNDEYETPLLTEAVWWVVRNTLHLATCPALRRVRSQPDWQDYASPVPTNELEVVRKWADRQVLHLCGRCHPLPEGASDATVRTEGS